MKSANSLAGKTILVTGATAGIGLHTLIALAQQDAHVIAVGRNAARCQAAERQVRASYPHIRLQFLLADLSLQSEVRRLAGQAEQALDEMSHPGLDVLLHIAGVYSNRRISGEGLEITLAVNHLAPFLLTHLLLPRLQINGGRVISVNSASHRRTCLRPQHLNQDCLLHGLWAYKVSKLASVMTIAVYDQRYRDTGVRALCLDPGLVNTDIGCKSTNIVERLIWDRRQRYGVSPEVPAAELVQLAAIDRVPPDALYWRSGRPIAPSRMARKLALQERVWEASLALCNI